MFAKNNLSKISAAVLVSLFASNQALAADDTANEEENKGLEIIQVTAQKRTESVQEVLSPLAHFQTVK